MQRDTRGQTGWRTREVQNNMRNVRDRWRMRRREDTGAHSHFLIFSQETKGLTLCCYGLHVCSGREHVLWICLIKLTLSVRRWSTMKNRWRQSNAGRHITQTDLKFKVKGSRILLRERAPLPDADLHSGAAVSVATGVIRAENRPVSPFQTDRLAKWGACDTAVAALVPCWKSDLTYIRQILLSAADFIVFCSNYTAGGFFSSGVEAFIIQTLAHRGYGWRWEINLMDCGAGRLVKTWPTHKVNGANEVERRLESSFNKLHLELGLMWTCQKGAPHRWSSSFWLSQGSQCASAGLRSAVY